MKSCKQNVYTVAGLATIMSDELEVTFQKNEVGLIKTKESVGYSFIYIPSGQDLIRCSSLQNVFALFSRNIVYCSSGDR